jgi:aryl-alcohol dehydrogenase-like predicted oxidoreductase
MLSIPKTDLKVYPLCLGGNVFGWSADEKESFAVLDAYLDAGGNFIDTADVYSEWKDGNVGGESEAIIGKWMKARGNRSSIVLATKVSMLSTRPGLSAANIRSAIDDSLRRLQTDYIDLYYSHQFDEKVEQVETLAVYSELISAGKIRFIGASNFNSAQLEQAMESSAKHGYASYVALQNNYNLVHRSEFEVDAAPGILKYGISAIPYFGLARGFLTGKYREGAAVDSIRAGGVTDFQTSQGYAIVSALDEIARSHGATIPAIALAWLRSNPAVSTPIASARSVEQLLEITPIINLDSSEKSSLDQLSEGL